MALVLANGNGVESRELADMKISRRDAFASRVMTVDSNDNELKNKIEAGTILTIPIIITGESKTGSLTKAIFPDLRAMAGIVQNGEPYAEDTKTGYAVVLDLRKKDEIRADEESGLKTESVHVHDSADVRDKEDPLGTIKRVRFRFMSFETIKLINGSDTRGFKAGTFAIARIEPRAWRDDNKKVAIICKLISIIHQHPLPVHQFVEFAWRAGASSLRFKTAVFEFRDDMRRLTQKYGAAIPKNDEFSAQFRNDNELMIFTGFNHGAYLDATLALPSGVSYRDKTADDAKSFKGHNKTLKKDENRYMSELRVEQWENCPDGYPVDDPSKVMSCIIKVPFWTETINRLGITSITSWARLAPINMPYLKALVLGRENAKGSFENGLTANRMQQVEDSNNLATYELSARINQPAPNSRLSFCMSTNVDAVLCDEVKFAETVGISVSAAIVKTILFDNKTTPKYPSDVGGSVLLDLNKAIICLSELKVDVKKVLESVDYEFRVITSARGSEPSFSQDLLGHLPIEEGNQLVTYLATTLGKKLSTTRDDYIRIKKLQINDQHILKRFNFVFSGEELILYVYAINKKLAREEENSFIDFIGSIKGAKRRAFTGLLAIAPAGANVESAESSGEDGPASEPEPEPEPEKKGKPKKAAEVAKKPEKKPATKDTKRKETSDAKATEKEKPASTAQKKGTKRKATESIDEESAVAPVEAEEKSADPDDMEVDKEETDQPAAQYEEDEDVPPPPKKVAKLSSIFTDYDDDGSSAKALEEAVKSPPTSPKNNGSSSKNTKKNVKQVPKNDDDMENEDFED